MSRALSEAPAPRFDPDYESPFERDVRRAKEAIAFYEIRAGDPSRLREDRAKFNAKANAHRGELHRLEHAEIDRLAALDDPDYDHDEQHPEETD
jgi:hypothetical protein